MKCPYRKRIITTHYADYKDRAVSETEETFEECLGTECPFYMIIVSLNRPGCTKAISEITINHKDSKEDEQK